MFEKLGKCLTFSLNVFLFQSILHGRLSLSIPHMLWNEPLHRGMIWMLSYLHF